MRHRKDVQVVRRLGEVILNTRATFPKIAIFTHLNLMEARALGETLIAATEDSARCCRYCDPCCCAGRNPVCGTYAGGVRTKKQGGADI